MTDDRVQVPLDALDRRRHGLQIQRASEIEARRLDWIWEGRIPRGKLSLVAGEGGLGKSLALIDIAARITRGKPWPCGEGHAPKGSVIFLCAEDDAEDTVVPRLMAAEADLSKVFIISAVKEANGQRRGFSFQRDLTLLEDQVRAIGDVLLANVDPITSYLGQVDSHKNAELRSVLEPLSEMAARHRIAVLANTHLNKGVGPANNRIIGSVGFVNLARAAFIVTADKEDQGRRLFIPSKANLGRPREALAYAIREEPVALIGDEAIWAPKVIWEDKTVAISADEAVAPEGQSGADSALDDAVAFLEDALSQGAMAVAEIKKQSRDAGVAERTLRRAKDRLGVIARKSASEVNGPWKWALPS